MSELLSPIAVIEAIATLLWVYAGLTFLAWVNFVRRTDRRQHIPHAADLLGNLVPAMIMLVVVVLLGSFIGLPSVVVLIAVLFPAGLAFGLHMSLNDIRGEAHLSGEMVRFGLTAVIGAAVIYVRQFA